MKKILLAFLIGTATLGTLSSCTKEYYEMVPSISIIFERNANQWQGTDKQAYITLPVPELTSYYVKQGLVSVAMSEDDEKTYKSLSTSKGQAYSFEYGVGFVTIRAEDPVLGDYFVEVPDLAHFKVTLTDADWVQ